jgi:hypothetical protein
MPKKYIKSYDWFLFIFNNISMFAFTQVHVHWMNLIKNKSYQNFIDLKFCSPKDYKRKGS